MREERLLSVKKGIDRSHGLDERLGSDSLICCRRGGMQGCDWVKGRSCMTAWEERERVGLGATMGRKQIRQHV